MGGSKPRDDIAAEPHIAVRGSTADAKPVRTVSPEPLLTTGELAALRLRHPATAKQTERGLAALRRLRQRAADGCLASHGEVQVQSAFIERLFAEAFEYRTLLRSGEGDYQLKPQNRRGKPGLARYDDVGLGWFGPERSDSVASGELKDAGTDLDAGAVFQAHRAVAAEAGIWWVLVSNFRELRLYRARDMSRAYIVDLTQIETAREFADVWAVFSRDSLLGRENSGLYRRVIMGEPSELAARTGQMRLTHLSRANVERGPLFWHELDERLRAALDAMSPHDAPRWPTPDRRDRPELRGDRLVVAAGERTIEATRDGVVRMLEYVGNDAVLDAQALTTRLAMFASFAKLVLRPGPGHIAFEWTLEDLGGTTLTFADPGWWASQSGHGSAVCPQQTHRVEYATRRGDSPQANAEEMGRIVGQAARELCFPFVTITPARWTDPDGKAGAHASGIIGGLLLKAHATAR
jgi:hypothetical protein